MSSISLEAFDGNLRGKLSQWILPSDICALPNGFQDQLLSGTTGFQTHVLLMSKQDSRAWLLAYSWDLTFIPETSNDWSLMLSVLQHLKKPILIVSSPGCNPPPAFWRGCTNISPSPTCVSLRSGLATDIQQSIPNAVFFPKLDLITEAQFIKMSSCLHPLIQQAFQKLDLRSLYRELRGAGASLCFSLTTSSQGQANQAPEYHSMWYYPEANGALRLHITELRMVLRTITERLAEPSA